MAWVLSTSVPWSPPPCASLFIYLFIVPRMSGEWFVVLVGFIGRGLLRYRRNGHFGLEINCRRSAPRVSLRFGWFSWSAGRSGVDPRWAWMKYIPDRCYLRPSGLRLTPTCLDNDDDDHDDEVDVACWSGGM